MDRTADRGRRSPGRRRTAADLDPEPRPSQRHRLEHEPAAEPGDGPLVGGAAVLPLPPYGVDLEIGWQLAHPFWGRGLAAEAGRALAGYAFASGVDELFAVVRPRNDRGAATARSVGMEWVGETEKYYDLRLQVYRLRKGEFEASTAPGPVA